MLLWILPSSRSLAIWLVTSKLDIPYLMKNTKKKMNEDIRRFCQLGPFGVFALFWCPHLYVSVAQRGNSYLKIIAAWEGSTIEQSGLHRIWSMRNCTGLRGKTDLGGFYVSNESKVHSFFFFRTNKYEFLSLFPSLPYRSREVSIFSGALLRILPVLVP